MATAVGIRTIAVFEALKGVLVLFIASGLLASEELVAHLHLNPAKRIPGIFLRFFDRIQDRTIVLLVIAACLYSAIRFIEAYGLWRKRVWAEWFAVISSAVYLPVEFFELYHSPSWLKLAVTALNLSIVIYLIWYRYQSVHQSSRHAS